MDGHTVELEVGEEGAADAARLDVPAGRGLDAGEPLTALQTLRAAAELARESGPLTAVAAAVPLVGVLDLALGERTA